MNASATPRATDSLAAVLDFRPDGGSALRDQEPFALPRLPACFRWTPEFQLLLACSLSVPAAPDRRLTETIRSLCHSALQWDEFLALVDRHGVPGPVYAVLGRHEPGLVPDPVRDKLKRRKILASGRALRHAAELLRLSQSFAAAGIEVLPLKGVALSQRLFGDVGMRQVRDLDLMVQPGDLARSGRLLRAAGYQCVFPDFALTPKMERRILLQDHHHTYWHAGVPLMLELHWRVDHWTPQNVAELWRHTHVTPWMGTTLRQLDDDVLLLFLCGHGAGHKWSHLKWLSDVASLLQACTADWDAVRELAARFDLEHALAQTALLVHWLVQPSRDTPCLPAPLHEYVLRQQTAAGLAAQALQVTRMDLRDLARSEHLGQLKYLPYMLRLRRRLSWRAYLRQVCISTRDFKDFSPPDSVFWLHYLMRPVLWLRRCIMQCGSTP